MPLYELGVIIDPEAGPDDEATALERLEKTITEKKGTIIDRDSWGRRRLAYQIRKKTHGIYHFWKFEADGQALTDLNFELRTNDTVLRSLMLNLDREMKRQRKTDRLQQAKAAKKAAKAEAAIEAEEAKS